MNVQVNKEVQEYQNIRKKAVRKSGLFCAFYVIVALIPLLLIFNDMDSVWVGALLSTLLTIVGVFTYTVTYVKCRLKYFNGLVKVKLMDECDVEGYNRILKYAYEHRKRYDTTPISFYLMGLMQTMDKDSVKAISEKEKKNLNNFIKNIEFYLLDDEQKKEHALAYYKPLIEQYKDEHIKLFHEIQLNYYIENYDEVLKLIDNYPTDNLYSEAYKNYFHGMALYQLNHKEEALFYFNQVIEKGNTLGLVQRVKKINK